MSKCLMCPRGCLVDRENGERGFCKSTNEYIIGSADLHFWEEPCISGNRGSGAIFFSGCNLRCVFCQNSDISAKNAGKAITPQNLAAIFKNLESEGAHNINLVTPGHYTHAVAQSLDEKLEVPVVYNSNGYDSVEQLRSLAFSDITAALKLGLEMTLDMLRSQGKEISKGSLEALAWLER